MNGYDDALITTIRFHGENVKGALEWAIRRNLDELWLLRTEDSVYLTTRQQDIHVRPQSISRLTDTLLSKKPQPHVEVIPLHNCVLRALKKAPLSDARLLWFEIQFNDIDDYRIHLVKPPEAKADT